MCFNMNETPERKVLTLHIPTDAIPADVDQAVMDAFGIDAYELGEVCAWKQRHSYLGIEVQDTKAVNIATGRKLPIAILQEQIREQCGFLRNSAFSVSGEGSNTKIHPISGDLPSRPKPPPEDAN